VRLPQIDATTCLGCYACVDACPYDVLEVRRYVAVVARPDACCGLTLCEQRCPNGSLVVRQGDAAPDRPRVAETLESLDVAGIYLAGDLTGVPLIRNAINQGASAVRAALDSLSGIARNDARVVDVAIVGAGPAGISAALEAKAKGLSSAVLEQGSVAESIRSFPRGKLVFDQPLGMPLVGELWLDECTKEELLGKWLRIVRRARLSIEEGTRVVSIERQAGGPPFGHFELGVEDAEGMRSVAARRVILAIGRRGSPRKLDVEIPESMLDRVHYSLADARSFAGARVVVVGLGDVAMETAIALARQPDTKIVVSYRGEAFRRGKARNIDEMRRLIEKGRIELVWRSRVSGVDDGRAVLATADGERRVDADALFVMIGAIVPWELLAQAGVRRTH
jgi:thioredoxin reductase